MTDDLLAPPEPSPTHLVHRAAIGELATRYALAVDRRALAEVAALFTDDAVLVVPRPPDALEPVAERHGPDEIRTAMANLERYVATMHALVGHVVEIDQLETITDADGTTSGSGRAHGVVSCLAHHVIWDDDGPLRTTVWGLRYVDDYAFDGSAWRFARRELWIDWIDERPLAHVREQ